MTPAAQLRLAGIEDERACARCGRAWPKGCVRRGVLDLAKVQQLGGEEVERVLACWVGRCGGGR